MLSRLYGNRAECWLKLKDHERAQNDVYTCINYDPAWYKVNIIIFTSGSSKVILNEKMNSF